MIKNSRMLLVMRTGLMWREMPRPQVATAPPAAWYRRPAQGEEGCGQANTGDTSVSAAWRIRWRSGATTTPWLEAETLIRCTAAASLTG